MGENASFLLKLQIKERKGKREESKERENMRSFDKFRITKKF